jgi:hypothetical protein
MRLRFSGLLCDLEMKEPQDWQDCKELGILGATAIK